VNKALRGARAIVFTHEHGDHITGVIRTPYLAELAPKTILTRPQVNTLENRPQFPDLQITEEQARRYHVIDYDRYMAFAPGWTLIKAAGHTPVRSRIRPRSDSRMAFRSRRGIFSPKAITPRVRASSRLTLATFGIGIWLP